MTKIMIEVPTGTTSRQEEAENLQKLATALKGSGSYMESLISQGLVDWFIQKAHDDFSCDIMEAYASAIHDSNKAYDNAAKRVLEDMTKATQERNKAVQDWGQEKARADHNEKYSNELLARNKELSSDYETLLGTNRDLYQENLEQSKDIEALKWQITQLKARVLDLQDRLV